MSLLQETVLDRLWTKYEHRFGHPPPIASATFEEAIAEIRKARAAANFSRQTEAFQPPSSLGMK